jgi:transcriptional regulator GlxA family with amidase domain
MTTTGILLFDDVEELDFVGPWEVLKVACRDGDSVVTVAEKSDLVRCGQGLRVMPDHTFADCPLLDVIVVPGGQGPFVEVENPVLMTWLADVASTAKWVTSVCTGTLLLWATGAAKGRTVATHSMFVESLREMGDITVVDDQRWVVDGNLVTAAGVSAGLDMALWLVGEIYGEDHGRFVQQAIEYQPEPPFSRDA